MKKNMQKLFLLDAYALIYRSYYAFINNPRITTSGINTSATFGFVNFLMEMLELENPEYISVVFDPEGPTFRHKIFPQYKAQRPPMPEDLRKSVPYIKNLIKGMGISCLEAPGYEADDLIGTIAKKAESEGFTVYMITPDKDYAQLVSENIFMYKPGRAGNLSEIWGIAEVLDRFGIEKIEQVVDILGLMGDTADNIPGCAGIGPKTAASLIYKYGDINNIYRHLDEIKGKQKDNLSACKDIVSLSRDLVTINTNVPFEIDLRSLKKKDYDFGILTPIFDELELFTVARRFKKLANTGEDKTENFKISHSDKTQNPEEIIRKLEEISEFSFFTDIDKNNLHTTWPSEIFFGINQSEVWSLKFSDNKGKNTEILKRLKPVFENPDKTIVSDACKDNYIWLHRAGIRLLNKMFDITIAHYLIEPDKSHDISKIILEYLKQRTHKEKDNTASRQLSLEFSEEPENTSLVNAELANAVFRLKPLLKKTMEEKSLIKLYDSIEIPLIEVLADMEIEGVCVDRNTLNGLSLEIKEKCDTLEKEIYDIAGMNFNINSPKQLGEVLFEHLKISKEIKKTKTGQYSTSETTLIKLSDKHPIIEKILDYRGLKKLITTYTDALPGYINPATGRIHTSFQQSEAATGRLSSLNPNLQNIPIRTAEGRKIRQAFVGGDSNHIFIAADYSQVELRLMAHLSQSPELISAFEHGEDIHAATASKIYHLPLNEVNPEMRRRAKIANFGIIYGISAWGLSERLKITRKEGKELIEGYFEHYPGVKKYMETTIAKARKQEFVETIMGRRRYLRDINSKNAVIRGVAERNAINAPIQGSAADIIKMAMIAIHRAIKSHGLQSKMILQVHDELDFICYIPEKEILEKIIRKCMEKAVKLSVPLIVSIGEGKNWFEAH